MAHTPLVCHWKLQHNDTVAAEEILLTTMDGISMLGFKNEENVYSKTICMTIFGDGRMFGVVDANSNVSVTRVSRA